ncbi:hypothetical protein Tco_1053105, partial [Tanacetum coccineum]
VVEEELDEIDSEDITNYVGVEYVGEEDVIILNIGINDTFLNKLVDGNCLRKDKVEDKEVDNKFKVKEGVIYHVHDPNEPWNVMTPLLGMKFEPRAA